MITKDIQITMKEIIYVVCIDILTLSAETLAQHSLSNNDYCCTYIVGGIIQNLGQSGSASEQLPCLAFGLTVTVRLADCEGEICCEEVGKHCCTDVGLTSAQVSQYLRRGDMSRPLDM